MPILKHSLLAAALMAASLAHAGPQRGELLPAAAGDLVPTTLSAAKRAPVAPLETEAVSFAWAIAADSDLQAAAPYVAESREFWSLQSPAQLAKGFEFAISSPGALIRISPAEGRKAAAVTLDALMLSFDGRPLVEGAGILRSATAEQVKALGADFGDGSLVVQLDPALGRGQLELRLVKAGGRHLIHVLEPGSDQVLTLSTDRDVAIAGSRLGVFVDWRDGEQSQRPDLVQGVITAPDGRSFDLQFRADDSGRYFADTKLPSAAADVPGLWEVHGFAAATVDGLDLLRDAKTSFALSEPSARLAGGFSAQHDDQGLHLQLDVEAGAAGRYELRGTVYGTRADGSLVPFAVAHAARMLEPGLAAISLELQATLIAEAGVGAPFELRELALSNQGTMSRIEQRAVALRLEPGQRGNPRPK
jgi:hypothetical protein